VVLAVVVVVVLAASAGAVMVARCCGGPGATAPPPSEPAGIPPIVAHDVWAIADRVALGSDQVSDGMYEFVHTIVYSRATTPAREAERWVEELAWLRSDGAGCRVLAPLSPDGKREPSEEPFSVPMDEPSAEMPELRRQLQVWSGGDRGPTGMVRAAAGLTAQRYLDRSQRVALVRVLATTEGVRPLGEWRDSHGRSGIAVQAVVETRHVTIREILMIDPRTASLLAHQTIEAPAGGDMRIVGEVLYLDSGRDRRPGCRLLA
jgi:hypothetical protein